MRWLTRPLIASTGMQAIQYTLSAASCFCTNLAKVKSWHRSTTKSTNKAFARDMHCNWRIQWKQFSVSSFLLIRFNVKFVFSCRTKFRPSFLSPKPWFLQNIQKQWALFGQRATENHISQCHEALYQRSILSQVSRKSNLRFLRLQHLKKKEKEDSRSVDTLYKNDRPNAVIYPALNLNILMTNVQ